MPFHTLLFPAYLIGSKDRWTKLNSISTTGEQLIMLLTSLDRVNGWLTCTIL